MPAGVRVEGESVYWGAAGEFLLFVPEFFFDNKYAIIDGEYISTMGVLTYAIVQGNGTVGSMRQFYFPYIFTTKPGTIEKVKNYNITENYKADCRIFHYTNNNSDKIIVSTKVPQGIENVEELFRLMIRTGKTPNTVRYDEVQNYFIDSMNMAGSSFKINIGIFGIVIGELFKDPTNLSTPFRLSTTIDKNMYGYKEISVVDAPKYVSPYASLTSENFDEGVIGALTNAAGEDTLEPSDLEKIFIG